MNNKYSHLYKNVDYIPPSVIRKMEKVTPGITEVLGEARINGNNSIESMTGQTDISYLVDKKLRNKDFYRSIKDKTIYSMSSSISSHSALNKLGNNDN